MNNQNLPLVSVLIPSYNHENFIEEAIMSVLQQTYPNIQLIVVDDGSTDNSPFIIQRLQKEFGFEYYQQKNHGLIYTLNKLGCLAKGDYISLFSSDDVYSLEKIKTLVGFLEEKKQYSMVYSKIATINSESDIISSIEENYQQGCIFYNLLCGDFFINSITTLIRRDVYFKFDRDDSYIDDFQFWLKIAKSEKIGFLNQVTAYYRKHNNHLSSNLVKMQNAEREILEKYSYEEGYEYALNEWNVRWMSSLACENRALAIKTYLPKLISLRNLINIRFYKALARVVIGRKRG